MGLKEAALDSPTFRSGFTHFSEQLDLVERWLENYVRAISKVSHEIGGFETVINGFLAQSVPPTQVSEAVLDHDYTLLAMKRYGEGAKEFWNAAIAGLKKMEANMVEPIRRFLQNDLRVFKETRKALDQSQKQLDGLLSRYSAQGKSKEASSLREDAFQVHEARKVYLKASMDFSVLAPQLRVSLDKTLSKLFADQWRDTRAVRQLGTLEKWTGDIERVQGWSREMENGERAFRRELQTARNQIEESAEAAIRPSRDLEDYSSEPASKNKGHLTANLQTPGLKARQARPEKQGWLNLRTVSGKPSRTVWLRRWFYVKNGIFGWLVQGSRSGAVEESERIGVLLCSVRTSNSDDRRYVFEVKTKDTTIILQAETPNDLNEWLIAFDAAKQKALEDPSSTESAGPGSRAQDPAFSISPPSAPEFAASAADSGMPQSGEDNGTGPSVDRSSTLPIPGTESTGTRSSFDVSSSKRANFEKEEGTRERLISKLDLHRKPLGAGPGGIASLIAASHGSMPVGPGVLPPPTVDAPILRKISPVFPNMRDLPTSTLAPNTLANPPAPTNLSATAVVVTGERASGIDRANASEGIPSGLLANVWGSSNWGHLNRLERGELKAPRSQPVKTGTPASPGTRPLGLVEAPSGGSATPSPGTSPAPHRKTASLDRDVGVPPTPAVSAVHEYPPDYPVQLKTQDAQFGLLFPDVSPDEKVVLVFKASWNPNDQQDFPGRAYVTTKEIYFYSNHCGMTMTTSLRLNYISEVTAAGGRDCDFLYLHLKTDTPSEFTRVTIKTFLEPLRLLQRRLGFLVANASSGNDASPPANLEDTMKTLIKMENDDHGGRSSPSLDSWENVSINTPVDNDSATPRRQRSFRDHRDLRANVLIDRGLYGNGGDRSAVGGPDKASLGRSFKLPKQPVIFTPAGMDRLAVEKEFSISAKALFHVLFGDKSAVWQLLYHERHAHRIRMSPWAQPGQMDGHLRREFEYEIEYLDLFRRVNKAQIVDYQTVDSANEHLLYVVSDRKTPWHLPYRSDFTLLTKVVITHVAKSRCKLALYNRIDWLRPRYLQSMVSHRARHDLYQDSLDLADVVSDQCRRLGDNSRTKKAVTVYGHVGVQTQTLEFAGGDDSSSSLAARLRRSTRPRTLTSLVFESCASMAESVLTSTFQILFRILRWVWNTISANGVILAILGVSIMANLILSGRNATDSWRERRAAKYMARLGIGPDLTMSKTIYLHELSEASTSLHTVETSEPHSSICRDTFNEVMNVSGHQQRHNSSTSGNFFPPSPSYSAASSSSSSFSSSTIQQRRFQRTRQTLGSQRHDLVVAMRIVDSIERETLRAAWETWLMDEGVKCEQIGSWIQRQHMSRGESGDTASREGDQSNKDASSAAQKPAHSTTSQQFMEEERPWSAAAEPGRLEQIEAWYADYCHSCINERDRIIL